MWVVKRRMHTSCFFLTTPVTDALGLATFKTPASTRSATFFCSMLHPWMHMSSTFKPNSNQMFELDLLWSQLNMKLTNPSKEDQLLKQSLLLAHRDSVGG
jgi:hypothetical protein